MISTFVIMPLRVDSNVKAKRKAILDIIGDDAILPQDRVNDPQPPFDIDLALETLKSVDLVIADLSFERPSCYFELGMAQAIGIPSFLIAERGTQLHQYAGNVKVYTDLREFRQLISSAVAQHAADSADE